MKFMRLTTASGLWQSLESQWQQQCEEFDEDLRTFAGARLEHAKSIAAEHPQDPRYGIFGLDVDGRWEAIAHVNRAGLPGTEGWTLRLLWVLLSPKFDYSDSIESFPDIGASVVRGAISIACSTEMDCDHVKLHLGNLGDRAFFRGFALAMQTEGEFSKFAVRGNWLHIESVKRITI